MLVTIRVPDLLLRDREIRSITVTLDGRHSVVSFGADIVRREEEGCGGTGERSRGRIARIARCLRRSGARWVAMRITSGCRRSVRRTG